MILGVVFVIVGLLGFVNHPVLGIFEVNTLHNLIHLVSGILAIYFANKGEAPAKTFAKVFGVIYLLVAVLGFALSGNILGLFMVNTADNLLHVVLGAVFLALGFMGGKETAAMQQP